MFKRPFCPETGKFRSWCLMGGPATRDGWTYGSAPARRGQVADVNESGGSLAGRRQCSRSEARCQARDRSRISSGGLRINAARLRIRGRRNAAPDRSLRRGRPRRQRLVPAFPSRPDRQPRLSWWRALLRNRTYLRACPCSTQCLLRLFVPRG